MDNVDVLIKSGAFLLMSIAIVFIAIVAFPNSKMSIWARDNHNILFAFYALLPAFMSLSIAQQAVQVQLVSVERTILTYENERRVGAGILYEALGVLDSELNKPLNGADVPEFSIPYPLEAFEILKTQDSGLAASVYLLVSNARRLEKIISNSERCKKGGKPEAECGEEEANQIIDSIRGMINDLREAFLEEVNRKIPISIKNGA